LTEISFDFRTFDSDTILNYQLFSKLKLIKINKSNHLIIILTNNKEEKCGCMYITFPTQVVKELEKENAIGLLLSP
jgi:hypothetical protein